MKLTTYFHLFLTLLMSGVIPLPHLYAFVVCRGTASPSLRLKSIIFLNTVLDRNLVFYMKVTFMEERKCPYVRCHCYWLHRSTWAMYHCWSVYLFHFTNVWIFFFSSFEEYYIHIMPDTEKSIKFLLKLYTYLKSPFYYSVLQTWNF